MSESAVSSYRSCSVRTECMNLEITSEKALIFNIYIINVMQYVTSLWRGHKENLSELAVIYKEIAASSARWWL